MSQPKTALTDRTQRRGSFYLAHVRAPIQARGVAIQNPPREACRDLYYLTALRRDDDRMLP